MDPWHSFGTLCAWLGAAFVVLFFLGALTCWRGRRGCMRLCCPTCGRREDTARNPQPHQEFLP
jgi:hypothetical protein